jgi:hypothetical protein
MPKKTINSGLNIVQKCIYDDITKLVEKLSISEEDKLCVIDAIKTQANSSRFVATKRTRSSASTRSVAPENQCTGQKKDGLPCKAPKTSKLYDLCWAHMNAEQRKAYSDSKPAEAETAKYTVHK